MRPHQSLLLYAVKHTFFKNAILFLFSCLVLNMAVFSQDSSVYVQFVYVKTNPGKMSQYLDLLKTYTKKFNEVSLKEGKILGWYVNTVTLPSGVSAEYDVVIVTVT